MDGESRHPDKSLGLCLREGLEAAFEAHQSNRASIGSIHFNRAVFSLDEMADFCRFGGLMRARRSIELVHWTSPPHRQPVDDGRWEPAEGYCVSGQQPRNNHKYNRRCADNDLK